MTPEQTVRFEALVKRTSEVVNDLEFIEYSYVIMNNKREFHTININVYAKGRSPRSAESVDEMLNMWEHWLMYWHLKESRES